MNRRCALVLVLCFACLSGLAFGEVADNFKPGGLEFGGKGFLSVIPDYSLFNDVGPEDRGDYQLLAEGGGSIGWFPIQNLSLTVQPSFFYWLDRRLNSSLLESTDHTLRIYLDMGIDYYLLFGKSFALSFGGLIGLGVAPGIDGLSAGAVDKDRSFSLIYHLEPKIGVYWFLTDQLAPYVDLGWKLYFVHHITSSDGSPYSGSSNEFPKYLMSDFRFSIGLKYFLPAGQRDGSVNQKTFPDLIESELMK